MDDYSDLGLPDSLRIQYERRWAYEPRLYVMDADGAHDIRAYCRHGLIRDWSTSGGTRDEVRRMLRDHITDAGECRQAEWLLESVV